MAKKPLVFNNDVDYTLTEGNNRVWITINSLSVLIRRTSNTVEVDVFKRGEEDRDPIESILVDG